MNQLSYDQLADRVWLEVRFTQADMALQELAMLMEQIPQSQTQREELELIRQGFLKLNEAFFSEGEATEVWHSLLRE